MAKNAGLSKAANILMLLVFGCGLIYVGLLSVMNWYRANSLDWQALPILTLQVTGGESVWTEKDPFSNYSNLFTEAPDGSPSSAYKISVPFELLSESQAEMLVGEEVEVRVTDIYPISDEPLWVLSVKANGVELVEGSKAHEVYLGVATNRLWQGLAAVLGLVLLVGAWRTYRGTGEAAV